MFSALLEYALVNYALRVGHAYRTRMMLRRKYGQTHYTDDDDGGGASSAALMDQMNDLELASEEIVVLDDDNDNVNLKRSAPRRRGKNNHQQESNGVEEAVGGYLFGNHFPHLQRQHSGASCRLHAEGGERGNLLFVSCLTK